LVVERQLASSKKEIRRDWLSLWPHNDELHVNRERINDETSLI
jgi:hypothetical protein